MGNSLALKFHLLKAHALTFQNTSGHSYRNMHNNHWESGLGGVGGDSFVKSSSISFFFPAWPRPLLGLWPFS